MKSKQEELTNQCHSINKSLQILIPQQQRANDTLAILNDRINKLRQAYSKLDYELALLDGRLTILPSKEPPRLPRTPEEKASGTASVSAAVMNGKPKKKAQVPLTAEQKLANAIAAVNNLPESKKATLLAKYFTTPAGQ